MADYTAALNVTPTHLTRVCRSETRGTAAALLTERILHNAHVQLMSDDQHINLTASDLGFGSSAYFTRFIQHYTGLCLTGLRRQGQNMPAKPLAAAIRG